MPRITARYNLRETRIQRLARARTDALVIHWLTDTHIWAAVAEDAAASGATAGRKMFYMVPAKIRDFIAQTNTAMPAAVLHTGDCTEIDGYPDTFAYFAATYQAPLDPGIVQLLVPGNHDYSTALEPGTTTLMETASRGLGAGAKPVTAGSRMNESVVVTGNGVTARFLLLDANLGRDAVPVYADGSLTSAQLAWVQTELAASAQDLIFICTHQGPHDWAPPSSFFREADVIALQAIVDAECAARPTRRIRHLFGHNHKTYGITDYYNLGPNYPGLLGPAMLEGDLAWFQDQPGDRSWYTKLYIFSDGSITWELANVRYPHS